MGYDSCRIEVRVRRKGFDCREDVLYSVASIVWMMVVSTRRRALIVKRTRFTLYSVASIVWRVVVSTRGSGNYIIST